MTMAQQAMQFSDGESYERAMGIWSRLVGEVFLDWLAAPPGLRWLDVGCGNGAFTESLIQRCAPAGVHGVDPSAAQIAFAQARPGTGSGTFQTGDAMALPFDAARFDAAVTALVLHLVPDAATCVAEMARVVAPGGMVCTYVWDVLGDGTPTAPFEAELGAFGVKATRRPSAAFTGQEAMRALWQGAGLEGIEARAITVNRTFADFDDLWRSSTANPAIAPAVAAMAPADVATLKARIGQRLPADPAGRITYSARANAITGRVPA